MNGTVSPQAAPDSEVVEIIPGLTVQWIFNQRCLVLSAQHTSRGLVDAWANKIIEVASSWQPDRILYILNDFSGKDCAVTQYNQHKNRELTQMFPNLKTTTALVVKQNLTMQLSKLFIRALPKSKNRMVLLTFNRDEALAWLKQEIEKETSGYIGRA